MEPVDILRRATTPMTDEQAREFVRKYYGDPRGNACLDDEVSFNQVRELMKQKLDRDAEALIQGLPRRP
jgi:hypothetical protein